jgi:hydroxyacylglutathione hydrolase
MEGHKDMPVLLEDEFGDIIKKARKGLGYSPDDVSRLTGIDDRALAALESYRRAPSREEIKKLSEVFTLDSGKLADIAASAWTPAPQPWLVERSVIVEIIPIDVGGYVENCYLLGCRSTHRAAIVDPGGMPDAIEAAISRAGLQPEAIIITHGHSDHIGAVGETVTRVGASTVIAHEEVLRSVDAGRAFAHGVSDGDTFSVGELSFRVVHTPGHTSGSCCFVAGLVCCVGDTIFAGSVGGAMGGPASYCSLLGSIRSKLFSLPEQTALLPGHGPCTTVGEELRHNPFF